MLAPISIQRAPINQKRCLMSRRQSGDIKKCEARFLPLWEELHGGVAYVLVWVCPKAAAEPTAAEQESICPQLFQRGFVLSCVSPSGSAFHSPPTQLQAIRQARHSINCLVHLGYSSPSLPPSLPLQQYQHFLCVGGSSQLPTMFSC